ncbi:DUF1810 domain-containing protein [Prevotella copri]|uniref:DUF1810 family protein n=1 Tax=Segatella copri TaxID=165179 RepID=UPI001C385182|nr:DUF1810 domain-containing protein [Segatella copri]
MIYLKYFQQIYPPKIWWIQKSSTFANFYGITCREEAEAYLKNKILNERLKKVCRILLEQVRGGKSAHQILGGIDSYKVKSCLTLFDAVLPNDIFVEWLNTARYLICCVRISLVLLSEVCGRKSKLCFYNLVVGELSPRHISLPSVCLT